MDFYIFHTSNKKHLDNLKIEKVKLVINGNMNELSNENIIFLNNYYSLKIDFKNIKKGYFYLILEMEKEKYIHLSPIGFNLNVF